MKLLIKKLLRENIEETKKSLLFEELSLLIEKELTIGASLKKKLSNINKPFADKLLQYLTSDKIPDSVTFDAINYLSDDDKTLTVSFKDRDGNDKTRKFKIGKLLDYIGVPRNEFKGYEIEELISHLKQGTIEDFKIVEGKDILWAYHCGNYDEGETMGSCMRYDKAQSYLKIYTDNPTEVKCLVLLNPNNGKVRGRALLWHMDNDQYFMDRPYMTNEEYRNLFNLYKEKNNFSNRANSSVTLENGGEYDEYPYMDTFKCYTPDDNILTTGPLNDTTIKLEDTGGSYSNAGVHIDYGSHEGENVNEDEAVYLSYRTPNEYVEGYAHQYDVEIIDDNVYLRDDCLETYDGDLVFRYDDNIYVIELTLGRHKGEYAKIDSAIELESNYYGENQWVTTDDDYIELDSDIYEIPYALREDTIETYDEKSILKDDAKKLYEVHYGKSKYAHTDNVTEVNIKGYGNAYILSDDVDEFKAEDILETNLVKKLRDVSENNLMIKRILRSKLQS
jgi:hypothetical protein